MYSLRDNIYGSTILVVKAIGGDRHVGFIVNRPAVTCGANFEELKQTNFGSDFEKLVTWWRLNKIAQHQALEFAGSAQF